MNGRITNRKGFLKDKTTKQEFKREGKTMKMRKCITSSAVMILLAVMVLGFFGLAQAKEAEGDMQYD
jgi:hypothetical protein